MGQMKALASKRHENLGEANENVWKEINQTAIIAGKRLQAQLTTFISRPKDPTALLLIRAEVSGGRGASSLSQRNWILSSFGTVGKESHYSLPPTA